MGKLYGPTPPLFVSPVWKVPMLSSTAKQLILLYQKVVYNIFQFQTVVIKCDHMDGTFTYFQIFVTLYLESLLLIFIN